MKNMKLKNGIKTHNYKEKLKKVTEEMVNQGVLFWILKKMKRVLKSIWSIFVFHGNEKTENPMGKIYQRWEENWLSDEVDTTEAKEAPFFLLFKYDYEYCCQRAKQNKKKNFRLKFCCILPFLIVTVLCLGGVIAYNINTFIQLNGNWTKFLEKNNWNFSIYGTVFYVAAILLTYVASKWLDVKQYQETWSRHTEHKYAVEMEMFKYISYMEEYYLPDRKQKFIENIMKTWDENQKKFIENMKKEKNIGTEDLISHIKGEET